jgi:Mrp family chromosome partitioning ATPase
LDVHRLSDGARPILAVAWASTPRELVETSVKQVSAQKRVAGVVFNFVNQDRAQKYGGEYYYGKSYEKYYSE